MDISAINQNILPNLKDDLIQLNEGSINPAVSEKGKIPADTESKNQFQDTLSISNDAKAEKEKAALEELKKVDREVQQHEAAHQAAAGELFRGKSFTYKIGPDGQRYAVAGDVQIDTSPIQGNPKATIAKMQKIRRAALAPIDPSSQDTKVAEAAAKAEMEAERQLSQQTISPSIPQIKIDIPSFPSGDTGTQNNAQSAQTGHSPVKNENEQQNSVSLNTSMHISTLFGSEQLSSSGGKHIDVSL